jgi:HSP20 family protein
MAPKKSPVKGEARALEPEMDPFWAQLAEAEEGERLPLIDIQDRDDHLLVIAELPGIPKQNVKLEVQEDRIEIRGEHALACELGSSDYAYLCNERTSTNFHRVVPLPMAIVPDKAKAKMGEGVLEVRLPKKSPKAAGRSVPVKID